MMDSICRIGAVILGLSLCSVAQAQSTLTWFSSSPPVQDFNPQILPGSGGVPRMGALVQLIVTPTAPGGLTSAPSPMTVTGATGGDVVAFEDQIGNADGNMFNSQTLASMGLGVADNVFLRLWNGLATAAGGPPTGSATMGSLAYYDTPVVNINSLPAFGMMFQYDTGPIATTSSMGHAMGTWVLVAAFPVELQEFTVD